MKTRDDAGPSRLVIATSAPARDRTVVVALDRAHAALRLGGLPDDLRARIDLVTSAQPSEIALPGQRSVIEVAIDADWGPPVRAGGRRRRGLAARFERLARDPIGTMLRRLGRGTGSEASLRPATVAIQRLVAAAGERVEVVPLDGHDHLAVAPLVASGFVEAPAGGLRRLADIWHARGGAQPPPQG